MLVVVFMYFKCVVFKRRQDCQEVETDMRYRRHGHQSAVG